MVDSSGFEWIQMDSDTLHFSSVRSRVGFKDVAGLIQRSLLNSL